MLFPGGKKLSALKIPVSLIKRSCRKQKAEVEFKKVFLRFPPLKVWEACLVLEQIFLNQ